MELISEEEVTKIVNQYGKWSVTNWSVEDYAQEMIGYLGDHKRLTVSAERHGEVTELKFFMKSWPEHDKWKAKHLEELNFFKKEFIMLSKLFKEFDNAEAYKWRPRLLYIREHLFVFEDVSEIGYKMPDHRKTLDNDQLLAVVQTLARFHAQSYIYEERRSKELSRPYRIWEDYRNYLQEPLSSWRLAGRDAVIQFLKVYSTHKTKTNFAKCIEVVIPLLFDGAMTLMQPSREHRNVIVHRDLWTNNIFLKQLNEGEYHSIIVDFQTVLYASPMIDLASLMFFNTTRNYRQNNTDKVLGLYYDTLSKELKLKGIRAEDIIDRRTLYSAYDESIMFGITQAGIIVPIIAMRTEKREELFSNPKTSERVNLVSRSEEIIQVAKEDDQYRDRLIDLLDEMVDRYVFTIT